MRCFIIMGVAGCGKTSVGEGLAAKGLFKFLDGDALHTPENVAKMSAGTPLNDDDRAPWLAEIGDTFAKSTGPIGIGCSALKRAYRDLIRTRAGENVMFVHLAAPQAVIAARINAREGHFMPPALLQSQFDTLEDLEPDETHVMIDIDQDLDGVISDSATAVNARLSA